MIESAARVTVAPLAPPGRAAESPRGVTNGRLAPTSRATGEGPDDACEPRKSGGIGGV